MRWLLSLVAMLLTFSVLPSTALSEPSPANVVLDSVNTATSSYCLGTKEAKLLGYVNAYRIDHGLGRLTISQTLGASARHHALSMAKYNYFSHYLRPEGINWPQNMTRHGYVYNTYRGENIAAGNVDPYATFMQWVNSPTHNALMLDPNMRAVGVGRAYNATSDWGNYWVLNFGGYRDARAPVC